MTQQLPIVLSASRRTDLAGCYPEYFIQKLQEYPPERVHTITVWTKNPNNMIKDGGLRDVLSRYAQIYVHLTITGLGGTPLEPKIPPWKKVSAMIPALLDLVKTPQRISWRFDPLITVTDKKNDSELKNLPLFPEIAQTLKPYGITTCRTSWVSPYKKVINRMEKHGFLLNISTPEEKVSQSKWLEHVARDMGFQLHYCCVEGFPRSRCIDGWLFSKLHPLEISCSVKKAQGQRPHCGCTESLDIGWYTLKCLHGCLYCYAEPADK